MTWVRWGDGSADHPIVLAPMEFDEYDDRLVNEINGFANRCAARAGQHMTDYVVTVGTARSLAGTRFEVIMPLAIRAGYFTETDLEDGRTAYKLCDDDPEFLHLRLKAEVDFERQRRADNSNPALTIPVRLRDGDACRWCGVVVDWTSRTSARSGTYDHLIPGEPATVETYVVCCRGCNSSRKDGEHPNGLSELLPAPTNPYFSRTTVKWLTDHPWVTQQGIAIPAATRKQVRPGLRVDGTQPPARDDTETRTRVAPSAPSPSTTSPETDPPAPADPTPDVQDASCAERTLPDVTADASCAQRTLRTGPGDATEPGQPPATNSVTSTDGVSADFCRSPQTLTGREGTDPVSTGRVGTGRVGTERVGRTAPAGPVRDAPDSPAGAVSSRRRRGGRRRTSPTDS